MSSGCGSRISSSSPRRAAATSAACPKSCSSSPEWARRCRQKVEPRGALQPQVQLLAPMLLSVRSIGRRVRSTHEQAVAAAPPKESLVAIREDARRERLIDMELRLRRYRFACFAILAVGAGTDQRRPRLVVGRRRWRVGLAGFAVADQFMRSSETSGRLGRDRLGDAAAAARRCGGDHRRRGEPGTDVVRAAGGDARAPASSRAASSLGTVYILALLGSRPIGLDPATAAEHYQEVMAAAALVLCTRDPLRAPWSSPTGPTGGARRSTR